MKISLRVFLALPLLGLSALVSSATPTISRMTWEGTNWNLVIPGPTFTVEGTGMSDVSVCVLVATETSREYPVELLETTATRVRAKLPDAEPSRTLIPRGAYRLKIGVPGQTTLSGATLNVNGTYVSEFTSSSVQSNVHIEFKGYMLDRGIKCYLRSDEGETYAHRARVCQSGAAMTVSWDPVPAESYIIIIKNSTNVTLWTSPTKFRVFANPTR